MNDIKLKKLKEKIITECPAWSVGYLKEMLDKLLETALLTKEKEVRERYEKRLKDLKDLGEDYDKEFEREIKEEMRKKIEDWLENENPEHAKEMGRVDISIKDLLSLLTEGKEDGK